jgi:porphobilinogen deaminase
MSKITPLYYANSFVDTVQDAKKKVVEQFVSDDKVATPLNQFIEAQRTFTKELNRSIHEIADYAVASTKDSIEKTTAYFKKAA